MPNEIDRDDLLRALHEGAFHEPAWSSFLALLREAAGADYAVLIFRGGGGEATAATVFRSGTLALSDAAFISSYRMDPRPYAGMGANQVYSTPEFLELAGPAYRKFHLEQITPASPPFGRMVRVEEPDGLQAWCAVGRSSPDFPPEVRALVGFVAPHLQIALRNYSAIQHERFRADVAADMVQRMDLGWLVLDAGGAVVETDERGALLLREGSVLSLSGDRQLQTGSRSANRQIADLLAVARSGEAVRPQVVHLNDEPWFDMLVLSAAGGMPPGRDRPVLAIYIHGAPQPRSDKIGQLMRVFRLSRNEARLAMALSQGQTIGQTAAELGITLESARTYSKRVYAKTQTRGQADLVRLILQGVFALT